MLALLLGHNCISEGYYRNSHVYGRCRLEKE